jgi:hypothetical protein
MRSVAALVLMAAALPLVGPDAGAASAASDSFVRRHRCAVVARLDAIHRRGPVDESRDRFIVVSLRDQPQHYVQCMFADRDSRMFCEAASGAYGPSGESGLRLDAPAREALRALRFVQDNPRENYARTIDLGDPPDLELAADLMLSALHEAYGAHPGSELQIEAPKGGKPETECGTPVS